MKDIFNEIAPGWYNFRHWSIFRKELEALAERWQKGSLLNIGCGHGADFLPFRENFELYGLDFSARMLSFAVKYSRKFDFSTNLFLADASYLPFADQTFDWAISVATYHHIRSKQERLLAIRELKRILKPGGEAFITVWNRWQPRFWFSGKEITVPWRTGEKVLGRYYYLFSYPELEKLVEKEGFQIIKLSSGSSDRHPFKFFSRNICLLVKKESGTN
ncbi:MAG: methyltransferase domain-containing protein [Dehalococcoidales bacterium]|nr:methyltransferase domain-containing protein [Dehalococcoidales bacterium]